MVIAGAPFRRGQVVPAVPLEEMRSLGQAKVGAGIDRGHLAEKAALGVPFLQLDPVEPVVRGVQAGPPFPMVPAHVDEPFAPVVIVEKRGVETRRRDIGRIGPVAVDGVAGDDVIVRVLEGAVQPFDIRVDQPEFPVGVGQAGCPDAAAVGVAAHVQLGSTSQGPGHKRPVHQIAGVVDLHARIPLEGRGGDVVILPHTAEAWVGIKAAQDGIFQHCHILGNDAGGGTPQSPRPLGRPGREAPGRANPRRAALGPGPATRRQAGCRSWSGSRTAPFRPISGRRS